MFGFWSLLILFWLAEKSYAQVNINLGLLMTQGLDIDNLVGYNVSAGSIVAAINKAKELKIYDPSLINITFSWYFDNCDESLSVGYATKLIHREDVSAIFGPVCSENAFVVGSLARHKNIPIFLWGPASPIQFSFRSKYPTTLASAGSVRGTFSSMSFLVSRFNWTKLAFVYTSFENANQGFSSCKYFAQSFESQSIASTNITEIYIRYALNTTVAGFIRVLSSIKKRARIIVSCLETAQERRNYMLAAIANNMTTAEYVHIFIQTTSIGFGNPPFWIGTDGMDNQIKEASKMVLILDKFIDESDQNSSILMDIYKNINSWPFYCSNCSKNGSASNLAVYLGDALLLYLNLLNKTYVKYGPTQLKNTTAILDQLTNLETAESILGSSYRLLNGVRVAKYMVMGLDINEKPTVFAIIDLDYIPMYSDDFIWATRDGFVPTSIPKCGFNDELCPPSPLFLIIIFICCILIFVLIVAFLALMIYFFQRQQHKRLNALWQIQYAHLIKTDQNRQLLNRSQNSVNTDSSCSVVMRNNTEYTEFVYYNQQLVVARKSQHFGKWTESEEAEFRKMRAIDHVNLNKFFGVSRVEDICYTLWECCARGNIIEMIKTHSYYMDAHIMYAMIRNIIEGLLFIHKSMFIQHGCLSAYNCVVGDRFDVKIQFYGLSGLKDRFYRRLDALSALYVAPEHLHGQQNEVGSQAGDIYSLAMICSVILNMKPAYGCENADQEFSAIIRSLAKGKYPLVRPNLEIDSSIEIDPDFINLVKKMWSEQPTDRPSIDFIQEIMKKKISISKSSNLMDYMFALMESNAAQLESDVEQRTLELIQEQKKADVLLYKMMPKAAADSLKLGQTVSPEFYDSATVLFSDIVSFTDLASKSTPLQIIKFLNDVYTLADSIIDKYDVYKVETIGDGMHVVSGVPNRNGHNHVKEIANMAIDFQRAVKTLKMPHLPDKQIQMRIGIHSGSCVAGIVGVISPRYVVFGDTVNISAKMESSGRAGRIHVTRETRDLLLTHFFGKYQIVERGETLVKKIGVMHTYWLVAPEEINGFEP